MRKDKYLSDARELEQSADALKKRPDKPENFEELMFQHLFDAGENYELGHDLYRAEAMYKEAENYIQYVDEESREELSEKISNLGRQRKNISDVLKGTSPLFQQKFKRRFVFATLSITSLLSALFFTSISLTGYSVFELTENNSRFVGTGLFILGLVFVFLFFNKKGKI